MFKGYTRRVTEYVDGVQYNWVYHYEYVQDGDDWVRVLAYIGLE